MSIKIERSIERITDRVISHDLDEQQTTVWATDWHKNLDRELQEKYTLKQYLTLVKESLTSIALRDQTN